MTSSYTLLKTSRKATFLTSFKKFHHFSVTLCHFGKKQGQSFGSDLRIRGGDKGDRTPDLMTASHALSQLSYIPVRWCVSNYSRAEIHVKQSFKKILRLLDATDS